MSYIPLPEEQNLLLSNLESVRESVLSLPNVLAVGIGLKETGGEFTDEIAYRIFVAEKQELHSLSDDEIIPPTLFDSRTDVLTPYVVENDSDVCGNERLTVGEHRPLQAGIAISPDAIGVGTLGWFGTLDADDTPILLTNKHVLYDATDEVNTTKAKTAQPQLGSPSNCCCCECGSDNVIGESIIGIRDMATPTSTSVDCAIAKIDPEFASNISLNITNNSTAQVLTVSGTATAVVGETVRKIGARSGFTRGTVIHLGDTAVAPSDPAGGTIFVVSGQVLIIPDAAETYQVREGVCKFAFSNSGDSGAVIVNDSNEIVALNWGGDRTTNTIGITVASNITNVLSAFASNGFPITLSTTPPGGGDRGRVSTTKPTLYSAHIASSTPETHMLEKIRDVNRSSLLHDLYQRHHHEILELINYHRPVTVAWHRSQGPAFVAAVARAARVEHYTVPYRIEGISREALLRKMAESLSRHGSQTLKKDIQHFEALVVEILTENETIEEIVVSLLAAGLLDALPAEYAPVFA